LPVLRPYQTQRAAARTGEVHLALIDAEAAGARAAHRHIRETLGVPTVLIMPGHADTWEETEDLQPAGYVLESFTSGELAARLAAVLRRTAAPAGGGAA
jgi:DNA-binding response OmpR family regulator